MLASRGQLRASFIRWALFTVPLCVLLGFISGSLGGGAESVWFQLLHKPSLFPEPRWFDIVWSVLYATIGLAAATVCSAWGARGREVAIVAFVVHFVLNLAWSPVFFVMHQITGALVVLALVVLTLLPVIVLFWKVRRGAALLLLPYLAWVCYAALLNYEFLRLNPDADGNDRQGQVERVRIGG